MNQLSLPLKFRPRTLSEVVGQDQASKALILAIQKDRVRQAYIFSGMRGTGKTSTARVLAKSLNCLKTEKASTEPCQTCRSCKAVQTGDDISVIEIDGATHNKVDHARKLIEEVGLYGMHGRFKIYIIDEVHMLTKPAFNALLKTIEEPPSHVKFILCTTELAKIPKTIQSRCQLYQFYPILDDVMAERLEDIMAVEGVKHEQGVALEIAKMSSGSLRDAITLLDQLINMVTAAGLTSTTIRNFFKKPKRSQIMVVLTALSAGDVAMTQTAMQKLARRGFSEFYVVTLIVEALQEMIPNRLTEPDKLEVIVDIILELEALSREVRTSDVPGALLEATLLKIALKRRK